MKKIYLIFVLLLGLNAPAFGQFPGTPNFFNAAAAVSPPTVSTDGATNITTTSATSGGSYPSANGNTINGRGVCWNTAGTPDVNSSKNGDTGSGSPYSFAMNGLNVNTTYYVRAYLITSGGTVYGNQVSFNTLGNPPTVSTDGATSITGTSATSGGSYPSANGYSITGRGVCWNTTGNPNVNSSRSGDAGSGSPYSFAMNGLTANTRYYVRAYVIANGGPLYGNEVNFMSAGPCGAFVSAGVYKEFMCHNLGADTSQNPNTPIQAIYGDTYKWGTKVAVATSYTANDPIPGWKITAAADGSWVDGSKTGNDPCPLGFRVPTYQQLNYIANSPSENVPSSIGSWVGDWGNFSTAKQFSSGGSVILTLPATGYRDFVGGGVENRGSGGYYWSSTVSGQDASIIKAFNNQTLMGTSNRGQGTSIRCVSL